MIKGRNEDSSSLSATTFSETESLKSLMIQYSICTKTTVHSLENDYIYLKMQGISPEPIMTLQLPNFTYISLSYIQYQ
jgi:hypothetical protein